MKKNVTLLLTCVLMLTLNSPAWAKPQPSFAHLYLHFHNVVNGTPLRFKDSLNRYTNANGDDFYVTTFKYYVSNIVLTRTDGDTVAIPDSYFLVNGADSSTFVQELAQVPTGKYKSISFIIGVDSIRNFAGAQTGCLDPAKGMFWTWKSGYIFVKMEGVSTRSTSKMNRLTFHIGGALSPTNTIRSFSQKLPGRLKIKEGRNPEININADVAALFKGKTTIDFSTLSFTMGGPKSVMVADNYVNGLFTVTSIIK